MKSGFDSLGINSAKLKKNFMKSGFSLGESHAHLKKIYKLPSLPTRFANPLIISYLFETRTPFKVRPYLPSKLGGFAPGSNFSIGRHFNLTFFCFSVLFFLSFWFALLVLSSAFVFVFVLPLPFLFIFWLELLKCNIKSHDVIKLLYLLFYRRFPLLLLNWRIFDDHGFPIFFQLNVIFINVLSKIQQ